MHMNRYLMNNISTGLITLQKILRLISDSTEVEGTLKVLSGLEWKDDLLDKSSSYFKKESFRISNEVREFALTELNDWTFFFCIHFTRSCSYIDR